MKTKVKEFNLCEENRGATLIGYAFLLLLIVLVAWAGVIQVGQETSKSFNAEAIADAIDKTY